MASSSGTPTWLIALLVIFAVAAAATFGLFVYRHAELANLEQQRSQLEREIPNLKELAGSIETRPAPLDEAIRARKEKIAALVAVEKQDIADIEKGQTQNEVTVKTNKELQDKEFKGFTDVMKEAPERRKDLATEEEKMYASERDFDERRRDKRDKIEALSQEIEGKRKVARAENKKFDDRIAELESRVRQLMRQLDISNRELKSDGQILAANASEGFVVIDRGLRHNLRKGTRFSVYNRRGGKNIIKGQLEIVDVQEGIATARVLEEKDGNDPLIVGDHLHNPVYDPAAVKSFAIRGDFRRFSKDEIARFIRESGGRVESSISTGIDYLVAGDHAEKDLEAATKLGMTIVSEDQLVEFVRIDGLASKGSLAWVVDACKAGRSFALAGRFTKVDDGKVTDFIRANGGRSGSLDKDCAGLIVGEGALEDMQKARELGVPVIEHERFAHLQTGDKR